MEQEEHTITCPYCWQRLEILVDPSGGDQVYTEDCQVCCHPIKISVSAGMPGPADLLVERE